LERWITFLNNAHKYDNKTLPKALAEIREIRKASQKLDTMYLDEKEKGYYDAQQKFWLDQNAFMKEAIEKAQADGKEKGKAEGKAEGELNSKIEIAKSLFQTSLSNDDIAKHTNLTLEKVQQLRHEKE
jgi:predicted transposase/invertase (TIGR01784 family)